MIENNLKPEQKRAYDFLLSRPRAAAFLGTGVGKTLIALSVLKNRLNNNQIKNAILIAPKEVCNSTWVSEINKWLKCQSISYVIIKGNAKQRTELAKKDVNLYIINPENLVWLLDHGFNTFHMLIVDESTIFKNPKSLRFKGLAKNLRYYYAVLLTATPVTNSPIDLWSQVFLLDKGASLGTYRQFLSKYFIKHRYYEKYDCIKPDEIIEAIKHLTISIMTKDAVTLPEINYVHVNIHPDDDFRNFYKNSIPKHAINKYDLEIFNSSDVKNIYDNKTLVNFLLQLTSGTYYLEDGKEYKTIHEYKIDKLKELLATELKDKNVLIAYRFKFEKDILLKEIEGSIAANSNLVDKWNKGEIKTLLANPKSFGRGINLQYGGYNIVWFSLTWSFEDYKQFNDRLHRRGQENAVNIYHLLLNKTIDETVLYSLQSKHNQWDNFMENLK